MSFKPLLAYTVEDSSKLAYPLYASPKLDGVRCLCLNGKAMSRSMKEVPNRHIQAVFASTPALEGFDGELVIGAPNLNTTYNTTVSGVMRHEQTPDFRFYTFDYLGDNPYELRLEKVQGFSNDFVVPLQQTLIESEAKLLEYEALMLGSGYEGVMVRSLDGRYKQGRSTARDGILGKVKRFSDSEAEILGLFEEMENTNEAETNELGRTKRSTAKDGLVGKGTLGGFRVRDIHSGVEFNLGGGFTAAQRKEFWSESLIGKLVVYKFFAVGVKTAPRFPVFKGFRERLDV